MEVELGNNPSFVWRNLLAAREIIQAGSMWGVGDGKSIAITDPGWLSHVLEIIGGRTHPLQVL